MVQNWWVQYLSDEKVESFMADFILHKKLKFNFYNTVKLDTLALLNFDET